MVKPCSNEQFPPFPQVLAKQQARIKPRKNGEHNKEIQNPQQLRLTEAIKAQKPRIPHSIEDKVIV